MLFVYILITMLHVMLNSNGWCYKTLMSFLAIYYMLISRSPNLDPHMVVFVDLATLLIITLMIDFHIPDFFCQYYFQCCFRQQGCLMLSSVTLHHRLLVIKTKHNMREDDIEGGEI